MTDERRTDGKLVPEPTGLKITPSSEIQQLLEALKDEAVRNHGYVLADWPHEAEVIRFLNPRVLAAIDPRTVRMRALDILLVGS